MALQDNNLLLNNLLISMARGFLQYVAECWPWVSTDAVSIEAQVRVLAARQRQDVGEIVDLLIGREHSIDFGSFPTEYTDLHFVSLENLMNLLNSAQQHVCQQIADSAVSLRTAGDQAGSELLEVIEMRQQDLTKALNELQAELSKTDSPATAAH